MALMKLFATEKQTQGTDLWTQDGGKERVRPTREPLDQLHLPRPNTRTNRNYNFAVYSKETISTVS